MNTPEASGQRDWLRILPPIAIYLFFAAFTVTKPLSMDETFPIASDACGLVEYGWKAFSNPEWNAEISHPPLYEHLLALSFHVWGQNNFAARSVGLWIQLAVLALIFQFSRKLYPGSLGTKTGEIAVWLFALNPYLLQHSLLVVTDTTVLPLSTLLFFSVTFSMDFRLNARSLIAAVCLFALCIWSKEAPPFFILPPLFLFLWRRKNILHALIYTLCTGLLGLGLFILTWMIYCTLTGADALSFYDFSIKNKLLQGGYHGHRNLLHGLMMLMNYTGRWITPAFLLALFVAGYDRIRRLRSGRLNCEDTDLLWYFIVLCWLVFNFHGYDQARYQYYLYPFAAISIGHFFARALTADSSTRTAAVCLAGIAAATAFIFLRQDALQMRGAVYAGTQLTLLLIFFAIAWILMKQFRFRKLLTLTLLGWIVSSALALNLQQARPYCTNVTWTEYGERGLKETANYLNRIPGQGVPVVRKDLAWHLITYEHNWEKEWIYNSIFRRDLSDAKVQQEVLEKITREDVKYIVLDQFSNPLQAEYLISPFFELDRQFGDFKIFHKRSLRFTKLCLTIIFSLLSMKLSSICA